MRQQFCQTIIEAQNETVGIYHKMFRVHFSQSRPVRLDDFVETPLYNKCSESCEIVPPLQIYIGTGLVRDFVRAFGGSYEYERKR